MSSRRGKEYKAILQQLLGELPAPPQVSEVVMDFERAMWVGVGSELPGVTRLGCSSHWTQAVWRKAQEIGLKPAYVNDEGTHVFIKKILALPFLPAQQIEPIFCSLTKDHDGQWKETTPRLLELIKYVNGTWIVHSTWNPDAWLVYGQSIRTNNDVEDTTTV